MCLQANRGAGERSERSSCATVDIYASVLLCHACLHTAHQHTNVCQSRSRMCVSQDLEQGTHLSCVADRHNRSLRRCGWILSADSIRTFLSTVFKLPRKELMYPLPALHSSTCSYIMFPIMDSKLGGTARQSRKRNTHTLTSMASVILSLSIFSAFTFHSLHDL